MSMHVVHIEDDFTLQDILRISFKSVEEDVQLRQYTNADDALPYIQENAGVIDLFILDIRLPGSMNGLQIAQRIRELDCPGYIVLTSAYSAPNREWLTAVRGEYIPKPWHVIELTKQLLQYRLDPTA